MNKPELHIVVAFIIGCWVAYTSLETIGLWGLIPTAFCGFWIGGWAGYYHDRLL